MRRTVAWLASFVVWVLVGATVVGAAIAMIIPASSGLGHLTDSQARAVPPLPPLPERTTIYDDQGTILQQVYFGQDRAPVPLSQVPQKVINAVLATEDREFYTHSGVDFRGIARAFLKNVGAGSVQQGGSTITQQLVKNTLFPHGRPHTIKAKLEEAILAGRLEQSYTKNQILERYLNTIYFGEGAYGIETAAERYFKKDVSQLGLAEGALLAGIISNPSAYDPLVHPEAARERRNQVLRDMVATGYITSFEAARYEQYGLPSKARGAPYHDATYAANSYFVQALEQWLLGSCRNGGKPTNVASAALGKNCDDRQKLLYQGGLKIDTTYDPVLQQAADNAVANAPLKSPIDAAIAVVDNKTGAVRAIANRIGYDPLGHQFDAATNPGKSGQGRQPGSSFKAFTLAAALDSGYSPWDSSRGGTCHFDPPQGTDLRGYTVQSDAGGAPSLMTAIAQSINCSFVNLEVSMGWGTKGPAKVAAMANRLGIYKHFDPITSLTLGTEGVTPLQLASAYSTFANDGVHHDPVYVTRIVAPDGTVLYNRDSGPGTQVVSPQLARTETAMLEGVLKGSGTAAQANLGRPAAGKTGTTTDATDLWFTGYTPELTASVWVGIEGKEISMYKDGLNLLSQSQAFGGSISAPIWKAFMQAALQNQPPSDFTPPDQSQWPSPECVSVDPPGRQPCYVARPSSPTTTAPAPGNGGKGGKPGNGGTTPRTTPAKKPGQ